MNRSTPSFVAVLCAATILLGTIQKGQESKGESEKPFAVFLYEAKDETTEEKGLVEAVEEVKKKFAKRDKWFQLVDNPLDAEVRVEVLKAWKKRELTAGGNPRTGSSHGERRTHYIEFSYSIPGKLESIMRIEALTLGEAAKKVPRTMKAICDTYCR